MKLAADEIRDTIRSQSSLSQDRIRFKHVFSMKMLDEALGDMEIHPSPTADPFVFIIRHKNNFYTIDGKRPLDIDDAGIDELFQAIRRLLEDRGWVVPRQYKSVIDPGSAHASYVFFTEATPPRANRQDYVVKVFKESWMIFDEMKLFYDERMTIIEKRIKDIKKFNKKTWIDIVLPVDFVVAREVKFSVMPNAKGKTLLDIGNDLIKRVVRHGLYGSDNIAYVNKNNDEILRLFNEFAGDFNDWHTAADYIQMFDQWYSKVKTNEKFLQSVKKMKTMCEAIGEACAHFDAANWYIGSKDDQVTVLWHTDNHPGNIIFDSESNQLRWIDFEALEIEMIDPEDEKKFQTSILNERRLPVPLFYPESDLFTPIRAYLCLVSTYAQFESYLKTFSLIEETNRFKSSVEVIFDKVAANVFHVLWSRF